MSARRAARRWIPAAAAAAGIVALAACAPASEDARDHTLTDTLADTRADALTVENCGAEVSFEGTPERAVLLRSGAVPFLHEIDVMDHVVARAGQYPAGYYDDETLAELEEIPLLTDRVDSSGHLQITAEEIVAQEPDIVLGMNENLPRAQLEELGLPLIEEPALCEIQGEEPSFDDIFAQLELYGEIFDRREEAASAGEALRERLDGLRVEGRERTAAVLFPTVGGGITYAYGTGSMATAQLEAAGYRNVFSDVSERVFEVSAEELITRDPDALVLLHSEPSPDGDGDGNADAVMDAVTRLPGAGGLRAVRDDEVMTLLFNFVEPATPLTIDGLEQILARLGE
ncbi:ABC transporter substrate-binding protein [Microbacterium nanhaiense]|uniref:ABC transporter substrate-binding protein n=1 Tax=Microbacterium nanhaiense TaxID=1301026 RepID=A0ABQ2N8Q5_9MICO|nr:ABC transporter substrate-binding protein [Microbacterium nanhaiense]GGO67200.1 ABC transporter substrate-binding protein [Microbacterium nanhaiense]